MAEVLSCPLVSLHSHISPHAPDATQLSLPTPDAVKVGFCPTTNESFRFGGIQSAVRFISPHLLLSLKSRSSLRALASLLQGVPHPASVQLCPRGGPSHVPLSPLLPIRGKSGVQAGLGLG